MTKGRRSNERRRNRRLAGRKGGGTMSGSMRSVRASATYHERYSMFKRIWERIKNEPVVLSAVLVAGGNLFVSVDAEAESAIITLVALVVRHFVTPTRKEQ